MKKSNIIIIVFSAFIVISILIFYIDAKKHHNDNPDAKLETVQLPDFSVVIAEENADVHIYQSDTVSLKFELSKDSLKKSNYRIANDTLHIYQGRKIYVYNKNTALVISRKQSTVGIQLVKQDSLRLELNGAKDVLLNVDTKDCKLGSLMINSDNTESIQIFNGMQVEKLSIRTKQTELKAYGGAYKNADLDVSVKSKMSIYNGGAMNNLTLKKDSTSSFNMFN